MIFEIEIMEIRNGPRSHESFQEMDLNDDWKLSKAEVCRNSCLFSLQLCVRKQLSIKHEIYDAFVKIKVPRGVGIVVAVQ